MNGQIFEKVRSVTQINTKYHKAQLSWCTLNSLRVLDNVLRRLSSWRKAPNSFFPFL